VAADILQTLNELIGKLADLITVQNNIAVSQSLSVSIDCGCNVGKGPDNGEGEEGGEVPDPIGDIIYDEPAPIDGRKCKAADYLANWLRNIIFRDILVAQSIDAKAQLGIILALGALGSILGLIGGIAGAVVGGVGGLLLGAILAIIKQELDFGQIQDVLDLNIQDLVCALYEATTVGEARSNFQQVLIDAGTLSSAEVAFTMLWLPNALLNLLFFDITSPFDSAVFFDGYEFVTGCDECGQPEQFHWILLPSSVFISLHVTGGGPMGVGAIDQEGGNFVINSVPMDNPPGGHGIGFIVKAFLDSQLPFGQNMDTEPTGSAGGTITKVTDTGSGTFFRRQREAAGCGSTIIGFSGSEPAGVSPHPNVQCIAYWKTTGPWSVTMRIDAQPTACPGFD
jgi:hypothetical protein